MNIKFWPLCVAGLLLAVVPAAGAQVALEFTVDPAASLVWWQIDPHYSHLWATTCPGDPNWRAGEGRGPEFSFSGHLGLSESDRPAERIPMYPRHRVMPLCADAVDGGVRAADTTDWSDVTGIVAFRADSLITGLKVRDEYARSMLFETHRYPLGRFTLDSVSGVIPGDTLRATAHGTFTLRGGARKITVPIEVWREAGGLRVRGQHEFPPKDLVDVYGMSRMKLGMGIAMRRWRRIHWGFDLVLRRAWANEGECCLQRRGDP